MKEDTLDLWERQAQSDLYKTGAVRKYVDEKIVPDVKTSRGARPQRPARPGGVPRLRRVLRHAHDEALEQAVRYLVRLRVREHVADSLGRALVGDVVDDEILRAALIDLFATLKIDPKSDPDLAFLAEMPLAQEVRRPVKDAAAIRAREDRMRPQVVAVPLLTFPGLRASRGCATA